MGVKQRSKRSITAQSSRKNAAFTHCSSSKSSPSPNAKHSSAYMTPTESAAQPSFTAQRRGRGVRPSISRRSRG